MLRAATLILVLGGCDKIFGLENSGPEDAAFDADPNCTVSGHDEDHDCIPDSTDSCPGIVNDQRLDQDQDGVGDACDPNPAMVGDRLIEFVSFAESDAPVRWIPNDAAWTYGADGDSFAFDRPVFDSSYGVLKDSKAPVTIPFTAIIRVVLEQVPQDHAQVGAIAATTGANIGAACSLVRPTPGTGGDFAQSFDTIANKADSAIPPILDGDIYELRFSYGGLAKDAVCDARLTTGGGARPKVFVMNAHPPGPFALEANGIKVRFESIAFYTR